MKKFRVIVIALTLLGYACSGSGDETPGPGPAPEGTVTGTVTCEGSGVAGVVVSDGVNLTVTDTYGRYGLPTDVAQAEFVFISIPSGYEAQRQNAFPVFYAAIDPDEDNQVHNFMLNAVDQTDYTLLTIADSHVLNGGTHSNPQDRTMYKNQVLPALEAYAIAIGKGPVYVVHLGDMTQDNAWDKYSLVDFRSDHNGLSFPLFTCIGNHDHDNAGDLADTYKAALGPTYYSFNIGRQHYVVLDNIEVKTSVNTDYDIKLGQAQLAWLKKDVAALASGVNDVVAVLHSPVLNYSGTDWMLDASEFFTVLKNYNLTLLVGHNHIDRIVTTTRNNKSVTEYMTPSTGGSGWHSPMLCRDGTPGSFVAYKFSNGALSSRKIVPWGENAGKTYTLYNSGYTNKSGERSAMEGADETGAKSAVMVNVWGAVTCTFTESTGGAGTSVNDLYDPGHRTWFIQAYDAGSVPVGQQTWQSKHLWRYVPVNVGADINVVARDEKGNQVASFSTRIK